MGHRCTEQLVQFRKLTLPIAEDFKNKPEEANTYIHIHTLGVLKFARY